MPIISVILTLLGVCWALIIIHPLPMLADMTDNKQLGTYTGVYYVFTSLASIVGPNLNGWLVHLSKQYNVVMLLASLALAVAFVLMLGVKKGESVAATLSEEAPTPSDEAAIPKVEIEAGL